MKKNVSGQVIGTQMISATDGSAFTSTVSCLVTVDGGTQTSGGGTVTHEGNGFHSYTPTQAETNGNHIAFTFTGSGAVPQTVQVYTNFPQTGDNYALLGTPTGATVSADLSTLLTRIASALTITGGKVDVNDKTGFSLSAAGVLAIWDSLTSALTTVGSIGKLLVDNVNATISSRLASASYTAPDNSNISAIKAKTDNLPTDPADASDIAGLFTVLTSYGDSNWSTATGFSTHTPADVWNAATRTLSSGANIVLAKDTGITGFNDLSAADVNAQVDLALADYDAPTKTEMDTSFTTLTTHGDSNWSSGGGGATAAEIADAVHDEAVDGSYTLRQMMRLMASVLLGKVSGATSGTETFRDISDTKNRVVATVDNDGNRSSITLDAS